MLLFRGGGLNAKPDFCGIKRWKKYLGPQVRQQQGKLPTPENEIGNKGTVVAHASADSGSSGENMLLVLSQD